MVEKIKNCLMYWIDNFFRFVPQKTPPNGKLKNCKIVAHRGAWAVAGPVENTIAAFQRALDLGAWGVEFDVRWTKDNVPIIHHNNNAGDNFGRPDLKISQVNYKDLKQQIPQIPSLKEVLDGFGKKLHFMIELKDLLNGEQISILKNHLSSLKAVENYNFLALDQEICRNLENDWPTQSFILVGEFNLAQLSEVSLARNYGGVAGHYLLVRNSLINRLLNRGQGVGVGYPNSHRVLFRELNRGVSWVFTNNLEKLTKSHSRALLN